jgi:drug/metabolite transporter (DMT)-like permease
MTHTWQRRDLIILVLLTLLRGLNWPVMKFAVVDFPPWLFRWWTMVLGLVALGTYMLRQKLSFVIPRVHWWRFAWLTLLNAVIWHMLAVYAIRNLSSGRSAILGYTMPIWVVVITVAINKTRLSRQEWLAVGATAVGIAALLWDELSKLAGKPFWVTVMLFTAAVWALGATEMRRKPLPASLSSTTVGFWMLVVTMVSLGMGSALIERTEWQMPSAPQWWAIAYTGLAAIAFAQIAYLHLARTLPSVIMGLSMMMIPVVGVFSGAWFLNEALRAADWVALVAIVVAIVSVVKK